LIDLVEVRLTMAFAAAVLAVSERHARRLLKDQCRRNDPTVLL
jgi:hypothetical protein